MDWSSLIGALGVTGSLGSSLFNLNYSRNLQKKIFEREDNALQRAVLDAQNAGLSPLSVTGSSNAGQVVNSSPLDFSQMNSILSDRLEFQLQQEQLDKQDKWHQNQIGVEQYNAETARINATTEMIKASEEIALKNKEFGQQVEEFVYKKINDELNRRHQAELQSSQQKHDINLSKLNHNQNVALQDILHKNKISELREVNKLNKDLQILLQSNAFMNDKVKMNLQHQYDVLKINIDQAFKGNENAKQRSIQIANTVSDYIRSIGGVVDAFVPF